MVCIFKINLKPFCSIKLMTIVKEYLGYKNKKEYGEKTLVLIKVGSFLKHITS